MEATVDPTGREDPQCGSPSDAVAIGTAAMAAISSLVMVLDDAGTVVLFNRACEQASGRRADEVLGHPVSELGLVPPPDDRAVDELMEEVLATGGERRYTVDWITPDGDSRSIEWSTRAVTGSGGRRHLVSTGVDVTDRDRMQDELVQAARMEDLGRLTGTVAHDLKNLLTIVSLGVDSLAADPRLHPELSDRLRRVHDASSRASELVSGLSSVSRGKAAAPTEIPVDRVVDELSPMVRAVMGDEIEVLVVLDAPGARVRAERVALERTVLNLATNAREAMPRGGRFTLSTRVVDGPSAGSSSGHGRRVLIAVSDSGCGMPDEVRARAFEPLFTTRRELGGTGLGLAIARAAVTAAGGDITLQSAPGEGTTVMVTLPVVESPDQRPDDAHPGQNR